MSPAACRCYPHLLTLAAIDDRALKEVMEVTIASLLPLNLLQPPASEEIHMPATESSERWHERSTVAETIRAVAEEFELNEKQDGLGHRSEQVRGPARPESCKWGKAAANVTDWTGWYGENTHGKGPPEDYATGQLSTPYTIPQ